MLSPRDIRNQKSQFRKKRLGGYDTEEVDMFLRTVADNLEVAQDQTRMVEDRVRELEDKLKHYERIELALQEALESARETGRRAIDSAEKKAALIVEEAELRSRQITQSAEQDRLAIKQDISRLSNRQAEISARMQMFLMSELEILAQFRGDEPSGFLKLSSGSADGAQGALGEPSPVSPAPAPSSDLGSGDGVQPGEVGYGADQAAPAPMASWEEVSSEPPATDATDEVWSVPPSAGTPAPSAGSVWDDPEPGAPPAGPAGAMWTDEETTATEPPPETPRWGAPPIERVAADPLPDAEATPPPAASGWSLRSLVSGDTDAADMTDADREQMRRIMDGLD